MTNVLAGVIGWPVSHSLSPCMHRFWLQEHGIAGSYVALPVRRHDLSKALEGLRLAGYSGVNLTLPHKEAAYAVAHVADATARASLAANLLLIGQSGFEARNTDAEGLVLSLRGHLGDKAITRAVVLGAGGAARAAVLACEQLGSAQICVLNRTRSRADTLVHAVAGSVTARLVAFDWEAWQTLAPGTELVINATSAGLDGTASPQLSLQHLPNNATICDLVYSPLETPLLRSARARGLATVDGLGMLMHQGALAFGLLFGARPEVSPALRAHLERALHHGA